jgi:hypothetical protein
VLACACRPNRCVCLTFAHISYLFRPYYPTFASRNTALGLYMTTPLSDAARAMGRARSDKKTAAARANGKLGGRPRKRSTPHTLAERCLQRAVLIFQQPEGK